MTTKHTDGGYVPRGQWEQDLLPEFRRILVEGCFRDVEELGCFLLRHSYNRPKTPSARLRSLMQEAADSIRASTADPEISDATREYRKDLERRIRFEIL